MVFVDNGSSVNVIFKDALIQMDLHEYQLEAVETALFGFAGHAVYPEGEIMLPLTLGGGNLRKTVMTVFTIVDAPSSYNIILGRPAMNEMRAVASTYHQKIKFPVRGQDGEVRGDQPSSRKCYGETVRVDQKKARREDKGKKVTQEEGAVEEKEVHFVAENEQEELMGISPKIAEHKLSIIPGSRPVKQKKRHFGPEKDKIIDEQVKEMLKAGHIREDIIKSLWPGRIRTRSALSLLGYLLLYGHALWVKKCGSHIPTLDESSLPEADKQKYRETFATLKKYEIKLNPSMCVFGVKSGKFLGFMVTDRGIEVNPEKIKAVLDMPSPQSIREVQKLTGRIATLSRFISRSAHRSYPFFQILRKAHKFGWDEKCEQAFQDLKKHLAELPVLVKPELGEKLWIYLSATVHAISLVLIREEGTDQKPVYYVSHALRGAELKYSEVEKIALALVVTARKLRPYFLSHPIVVLTNSPLGKIMTHAEVSGRMIKWTIELGEYDIEYKPRAAIKAQALTDFLIEMIHSAE
ncbi:uncharacterized protein [Primulina huaijiensis]|uniref:uncharacterized protein n=1 Tax=Primulina huaijiensis TaxID=1492673 RepID=UPI003CC6E90D